MVISLQVGVSPFGFNIIAITNKTSFTSLYECLHFSFLHKFIPPENKNLMHFRDWIFEIDWTVNSRVNILSFGHPLQPVESQLPDQGLDPGPL